METRTHTIAEKGIIILKSFRPADHQLNPPYILKVPVKILLVKKGISKCGGNKEKGGNKEMIAFPGDILVVINALIKLEGEEKPNEDEKGVTHYIFRVESKVQSNKRHNVIWKRPKEEIDEHCEFIKYDALDVAIQVGKYRRTKKSSEDSLVDCFKFVFGVLYNTGNPGRVLISIKYYEAVMMYLLTKRRNYNSEYLSTEGIFRFYNKLTGTCTDHRAMRDDVLGTLSWYTCSEWWCELCYPRGAQVEEPRPESLVQTEVERKEEGPEVLEQVEAKEDEIGMAVEQ